jgi:hypothetical protein
MVAEFVLLLLVQEDRHLAARLKYCCRSWLGPRGGGAARVRAALAVVPEVLAVVVELVLLLQPGPLDGAAQGREDWHLLRGGGAAPEGLSVVVGLVLLLQLEPSLVLPAGGDQGRGG